MSDMTYRQLQQAVTALAKAADRSAEDINAHVWTINKEATDTARVAEMIAAMKVDRDTIAETRELAKIMTGVSESGIAYATAGATTAKAARAVHEQARLSHDGVQEAVSRSGVDGIHDVDRSWFEQQ